MELVRYSHSALLIAMSVLLAACGGGSDEPSAPPAPSNSSPNADAGADQVVLELSTVNLDGSASSDPDGDVFTYAWLQTAGPNVALSDASVAQPNFTAPDITAPTVQGRKHSAR